MAQGALITFWMATSLYAAATVLYGYFFFEKRQKLAMYATFATAAGFALHTASIGFRWAERGSFPFEGRFESLLISVWGLVVLYWIVEHLTQVKLLGSLLVPVALVGMVVAQLNFETPGGQIADVLDSWRVGIHVIIVNLANAGYAIGAAASIFYLVQEAQLKSHRTNVFFKRLPSLATTDRLARRAIAWAFPAYTGGLLLGTIRAVEFDVSGWYLDPRVLLAVIVWVAYGAYLYLRQRSQLSGRTAAWMAIAGFVVVVALAIVARAVPAGFHIFGGA